MDSIHGHFHGMSKKLEFLGIISLIRNPGFPVLSFPENVLKNWEKISPETSHQGTNGRKKHWPEKKEKVLLKADCNLRKDEIDFAKMKKNDSANLIYRHWIGLLSTNRKKYSSKRRGHNFLNF